jgi:hypothetical protein
MMQSQSQEKMDDDDPFGRFLSASKREPFYSNVRTFRDLIQREKDFGRLNTPSAFDAERRVEMMRLRFADVVLKGAGTGMPFESWSMLSPDRQDEFICLLFLPRVLGGLFDDDDDDDDIDMNISHDVDKSPMLQDDDSEKNANMSRSSEEDDMGEISSLDSDRNDGEWGI